MRCSIILDGKAPLSPQDRAVMAETLERELSERFELAHAHYHAGLIEPADYNAEVRGLIWGMRALTEWMLSESAGQSMH
jgi:hypothetical protein